MSNRFKRYEKKYRITEEQYNSLQRDLQEHLLKDAYHQYTIKNVYYDDETYKVIRHSISKPVFKQKLRIRSYDNDFIFFEIKKKYKGEVFKRRVVMNKNDFDNNDFSKVDDIQTLKEINYFLNHENIHPKILLQYDREAYKGIKDNDLRITFDSNLIYSVNHLDLTHELKKDNDLLKGKYILEIKAKEAIPLWLSTILNNHSIYPTPFSKYGYIYKNYILKNNQKEVIKHV